MGIISSIVDAAEDFSDFIVGDSPEGPEKRDPSSGLVGGIGDFLGLNTPRPEDIGGTAIARELQRTQREQANITVGLLEGFKGPGATEAVQSLRGAIPELDVAADVSEGAFGADIGSDFASSFAEAAAARGLDPSKGPAFNSALAANRFLPTAAGFAGRTGFENLGRAGFGTPAPLSFGALGDLKTREVTLQSSIEAGEAQSRISGVLALAPALEKIISSF